ncbi:hypothetical protein GCM10022403_098420 [Streptomyces coacervatus]|uniref:Integral membrane protein n=1 Tax=Streptomyces coacervatus TaxID=647381 RepID=A0ABP7JQ88_9ACTN
MRSGLVVIAGATAGVRSGPVVARGTAGVWSGLVVIAGAAAGVPSSLVVIAGVARVPPGPEVPGVVERLCGEPRVRCVDRSPRKDGGGRCGMRGHVTLPGGRVCSRAVQGRV